MLDPAFAKELLKAHKASINKQRKNVLSTFDDDEPSTQSEELVQLGFCDAEDEYKQYILLLVKKTEFERAHKGKVTKIMSFIWQYIKYHLYNTLMVSYFNLRLFEKKKKIEKIHHFFCF